MNLSERIKGAIKARNSFSLSYDGVLTADWGDIVPVICKEMVPTDNFVVDSQVFMRLAPLASPTFGRIHGFVNNFYVPNRILMPEYAFEDSITGGTDGEAPERFPFITFRLLNEIYTSLVGFYDAKTGKRMLKLLSYLGLGWLASDILNESEGLGDDEVHSVSFLPFAAIFRIYGDYYFPYGLEDDANVREALHYKWEGLMSLDGMTETLLQKLIICFGFIAACYQKDYFTTAFTSPQRGSASMVSVDLSTQAIDTAQSVQGGEGTLQVDGRDEQLFINGTSSAAVPDNVIGQFKAHAYKWASSIQAFLERNNIAGGRYFEQMLARFGVKLSAELLNRSKYLGGSDFWVNIGDVKQTNSVSSTPQSMATGVGKMAGQGVALGKQNTSFRADEYGFFISLLHFVPETGYVDGLERMWTRHDKLDYWTPETEDTGMRPIYNRELNGHIMLDRDIDPESVFGYVPQYSEYKFANPILGGDYVLGDGAFAQEVMDSYHLYRRVTGNDYPTLNVDFVRLVPQEGSIRNNFNRIFQYTDSDSDHFLINTQVKIGANRPMLGYAESGMEFANDSGNGSVVVPYGGVRL